MRPYGPAAFPLLLFLPCIVLAGDWRPVADSELSQKTPRVDSAADAEAIFWDVRVEDRAEGGEIWLVLNHYVRLKIFTDRGKEKYATVELALIGRRSISNVAGRTIKPDGTILELKKDAIFERDLAKTKGFKIRGKSFTMPNVEVGDIIEYRYSEKREGEIASHLPLPFQREIPVWNVSYHVKPLNSPYLPYGMRYMTFQCVPPPLQKEPDGFFATSMSNMAAFQEEPDMPPEDDLRAWMLVYYERDRKISPEEYWKDVGKSDFNSFKPRMNANTDVKRLASELTAAITGPQEQLAALDMYCRTNIENLSVTAWRKTAEQRKDLKDNRSPGDTLKHQAGWGTDVNLLFAAMANAIGFDARMARLPDRGEIFFNASRPLEYFMRSFSVAVKVNDTWKFYDPATPYLEPGMLRWQEEGVQALISDPKAGFFVRTQYSPPARSARQRHAILELLDDGSIEGTVDYTLTGHEGREWKRQYDDLTPVQREERWKELLVDRLSTAEISGFEMRDVQDPVKHLSMRHKVTVPGYAIRTGKRLLFQPAFFQHNLPPRFSEGNRKWPLYFEYGWAEDDEVTIALPEGWDLDEPVAPASSNLGDVGTYKVEVRKTIDGRNVIYKRHFEWGRDMKLMMPPSSYLPVKKIFDFVQQQDSYTIALKAAANAK